MEQTYDIYRIENKSQERVEVSSHDSQNPDEPTLEYYPIAPGKELIGQSVPFFVIPSSGQEGSLELKFRFGEIDSDLEKSNTATIRVDLNDEGAPQLKIDYIDNNGGKHHNCIEIHHLLATERYRIELDLCQSAEFTGIILVGTMIEDPLP